MSFPHLRRAGIPAVAFLLSACASGPSDFADLRQPAAQPTAEIVKTETQQQALASELQAAGSRHAGAGQGGADVSSAMALAVIRQQQNEEARKLLEEMDAGSAPGGLSGPSCEPSVDPECTVDGPAAPSP